MTGTVIPRAAPDLGFEDLNPPLKSDDRGDTFFGCLTWLLIFAGVAGLLGWLS